MKRSKSKKQDISYFPTVKIIPAPENSLLYDDFAPNADEDDYKLYLSIMEEGIKEPLQISADGVLLSGHRRHAAARCLKLEKVPCIIAKGIIFSDLTADERLQILSIYNRQRDKSNAERLREALLEVDPEEAYARLRQDRIEHRQIDIEDNVTLGVTRKRARITTKAFLEAAQNAIYSEKEYWPLTVRRVHYLLLNAHP
jgi:septum formation topological specificity factor MinE